MSINAILHRAAERRHAAAELAEARASGRAVPLPDHLRGRAAELATFYRELPRLVEGGDEGRFAVVRGAEVESVWDTAADANQHGHNRFDDGQFLAAQIDLRWLDSLERYFLAEVKESA